MMKKFLAPMTIFFALSFAGSGYSEGSNYNNRFGLRLDVGAAPYASLLFNNTNEAAAVKLGTSAAAVREYVSAGVNVPITLDVTYAITNALEIFVGGKYQPSFALFGNDPSFVPGSVLIGYRYYINVKEPVKAFFGNQIGFGIIPFAVEAIFDLGLQWDITDLFSLFLRESLGIATVFNGGDGYGLGFQPSATLAFGGQFHF